MGVLVFRTSVGMQGHVKELSSHLNTVAGEGQWSFDLEDCDRVLRVVGSESKKQLLITLLEQHGHHCEELEDIILI